MTADLQTRPESEQRNSTPATRRRARRRVLIGLVIALPLVTLLVWGFLGGTYQPILIGNGSYGVDVQGPRQQEVQRYDTYSSEHPGEVVVIPFQKDGTLRVMFPMTLAGQWPVRITDFDYGPDPRQFVTVLEPTGVEVTFRQTGEITKGFRPFEPFTLGPRDNPHIAFNYRFVCQRAQPDRSNTFDTFRVRFRVFGASRWIELPMMHRLVTVFPSKEDCPPGSAVFR